MIDELDGRIEQREELLDLEGVDELVAHRRGGARRGRRAGALRALGKALPVALVHPRNRMRQPVRCEELVPRPLSMRVDLDHDHALALVRADVPRRSGYG